MTKEHLVIVVRYILIGLGILCAVLLVFAFIQYRALRHEQLVNDQESWIISIIKNHGPLTANDVNIIRPWMTFDYVNKIFNLPVDYLKTNVPVTDARYPALSLGSYAREASSDPNAFALTVASSVRAYMTAR